MPIRVDVNGQMVEFPDGTPDDVIDAAVKRDFFGPKGNAAERFGKSFLGAINPIPAIKAVFTDPAGVARNLVDTRKQFRSAGEAFARAIPGGNVEPSVMEDQSRLSSAAEGVGRSVAAIPVLGPMVEGVATDLASKVKSGDLAGAAGTVTGLVGGPKLVSKVAAPVRSLAPLLRASAERGYGKIFDQAADAAAVERVVPELIDRRVRTKNPSGDLAQRADTELARLPVGTKVPADFTAPSVKPLNREAGVWTDAKALAQGAPEARTMGGVLKDSVPPLLAGAVATKVAPIVGAPLTAGKLLQTVKQLIETPQFRSASAVTQARLADALRSGRLEEAAAIAGQIMRGGAVAGEGLQ